MLAGLLELPEKVRAVPGMGTFTSAVFYWSKQSQGQPRLKVVGAQYDGGVASSHRRAEDGKYCCTSFGKYSLFVFIRIALYPACLVVPVLSQSPSLDFSYNLLNVWCI